MTRVRIEEILSPSDYEQRRPVIQQRIFFQKARRRVHAGEHLSFLFENAETVRYQVQEMLRIEKRSAPSDVEHEVATYNELIGGAGELGCTLLIEIDDAAQRNVLLREWLDLPHSLYAELEDGRRVRPTFDERQVGTERVSSVHYLVFPVGERAPVAVGCDLPACNVRAELSADSRAALQSDLDAAAR